MATAAQRRRSSPWVMLGVVILIDVGAMTPVGLLGMFAGQVRRDLDVSAGFIGMAVGAFFLAGSLTAASAGSLIDRLGLARVILTAAAVSTLSQLTLTQVSAPALLIVLIAVTGGCFAMTLPATNAVLGTAFSETRRTIAVCIKQSAVPLSLVLGALAEPALTQAGGWTTAQFGSATLLLTSAVMFRCRYARIVTRPSGSGQSRHGVQRGVLRVACAMMLASCLAGSLTAYSSLSLKSAGASIAMTATVVTCANLAGIGTRLMSGFVAQRFRSESWIPVASMMILGGLSTLLIAYGPLPAVTVGTFIAYGLGWGWTGLTYSLVLEANLDDPAATGAVLQAGGMLGSASGPVVMAVVMRHGGLDTAWSLIGAVSVIAGLIAAWPELNARSDRSSGAAKFRHRSHRRSSSRPAETTSGSS